MKEIKNSDIENKIVDLELENCYIKAYKYKLIGRSTFLGLLNGALYVGLSSITGNILIDVIGFENHAIISLAGFTAVGFIIGKINYNRLLQENEKEKEKLSKTEREI